MATQMGATTRNKKPRNQIAELNARQALLPTMLYNQQRAKEIATQEDQFSRQHDLAQRTFAADQSNMEKSRQAADRASQVGMGLSAAKLGTNIGMQHGDKTVGGLIQGTKNMWAGTPGATAAPSSGSMGFVNNLSIGSALGGGLAGFGVSQLIGGKSKVKKALLGAAAGAGLGLLGGTGASGVASGTFGGLIGGLFG